MQKRPSLSAILEILVRASAQGPDPAHRLLMRVSRNFGGSRGKFAARARFSALAVISAILIFVSCRHSDNAEALGTTAQIARAVEMIRLSSNHDKRLWLDRLRALPCKSEDVCQLQAVCVHAYDGHLKAIELIDLARHTVALAPEDAAIWDASAESILQSAAMAQNAQRLLGKSRQLTRNCAENEAIIRQRYRIR